MSGSFATTRAWLAATALAACLVLSGAPARAGDGSGTDNPALLRGTYGLTCGSGGPCIPSTTGWPTTRQARTAAPPVTPTAPRPGNCEALKAAGIVSAACSGTYAVPVQQTQTPVAEPQQLEPPVVPASAPRSAPMAAPQAAPVSNAPPPVLMRSPQGVAPAPQASAVPVQSRRAVPTIPPQTIAPQAVPMRTLPPIATRTAPIDTLPTASIGDPQTFDDAMTGTWSIGLRGSSVWDGTGQHFAIVMSPSGQLTLHRVRGEMRLSAGLGLSYEPGGDVSLQSGSGAFELDHELTRDLVLRSAFRLDVSRDAIDASTPTGVEQGALNVFGSAEAGLDYSAGRAGFSIGGSVSRRYVGETTMSDGTTSANDGRTWSGFGLTARASYRLTPILSAFVQAAADRAYYDAVDAGLGAPADNWSLRGTAGIDGKWGNGLTASLYGGYGMTLYDSDLIANGSGFIVGGSLTAPVLDDGEVTASLETGFEPDASVAGATTKITYSAALNGRYLVNDWLTLRGALGGSYAIYPGASDTETGLSAGLGLDWVFGQHVTANADYEFGNSWTSSTSEQSHTVSIGMTVSR